MDPHTTPVPWRYVQYLHTLLLKVDALKEQPSSTVQLIAEFGIGAVKQCAYARCPHDVFISAAHDERFLEDGCSVRDYEHGGVVAVRWVYLDNATGEKYLYDHSTGKAFCGNCRGKQLTRWVQETDEILEKYWRNWSYEQEEDYPSPMPMTCIRRNAQHRHQYRSVGWVASWYDRG